MRKTYEEILDTMRNAYFEECVVPLCKNQQAEKRLDIFASELFAVSCYGDYIFRQAFVQTATGENLDRLGALRGCKRKTASAAEGELVFSIAEPCAQDIAVPAGTVCSVQGRAYLQFETLSDGVIRAGEAETAVRARAIFPGSEGNAAAGEITVMVNAPAGIYAVTNRKAFEGGCSTESDSAYRNRIMRHHYILPNGINTASYENRVLMLDYVTDCRIVPAFGAYAMMVYVSTKSNTLSRAQEQEIAERIPIVDAAAIDYEIVLAKRQTAKICADVQVMTGFDKAKISREIEEKITDMMSVLRIGEGIAAARLEAAAAQVQGVKSCCISSPLLHGLLILPDGQSVISSALVEVNCYDE